MNELKRGDVYMIPGEYEQGSHILSGSRPFIVVQNNVGNLNSSLTIVVPLTTKIRRLDIPTHVPMIWSGLRGSMAMREQVRTVDIDLDEWEYICHLPDEIMEHVDNAIRAAFFFEKEDMYDEEK